MAGPGNLEGKLTTTPDGATIEESPNHIVPVQAERSQFLILKKWQPRAAGAPGLRTLLRPERRLSEFVAR